MHLGFSASNGQGSTVHIVDWWQFKTFGFLLSVIPMDTIEEGDSFLCYSEDESINDYPFPFDPHERRKKAVEMALGLGGLAAFFFFIFEIIAAISYFLIKKKRLTVRRKREGLTCRVQTSRVPSRLSLAEIRLAL